MGKTLTEKIIEQHLLEGKLEKGTDIAIKIDQTLSQDATGTMLIIIHYKLILRTQTITGIFKALLLSMVCIFRVRGTEFVIKSI